MTRVVSAQKPSFQGIDPSSHQGPNELLAPWTPAPWTVEPVGGFQMGDGKSMGKHGNLCVFTYIFVGLGKWNHISLSWILRPWMGMIPHIKTMISSEGEQWGRYNLPRYVYIYIWQMCHNSSKWECLNMANPRKFTIPVTQLRKISCYIYIYISMISP